ncbi:MAG: histidinol dehydrogenase [Bacteroidales bacterium]|nr:histidinol dehydrogenase [Bacteroidales bacterium]
MKVYINPDRRQWQELCARPSADNSAIRERVEEILRRVREGGDAAIKAIEAEIASAAAPSAATGARQEVGGTPSIPEALREAIAAAAANIRAFHAAQLPKTIEVETTPGVRCIQKPVAIRKVGLYIPGGTAPLFSTVLMLAIPAKLAGCEQVILCTPAGPDGQINPVVRYAAEYCGVDRIFPIGGAQAIAAMAYGTETVPKVDKIFGPGNRYVTTAKQILGGTSVAIDMPAGPSEVMVIADNGTDADCAASDLLSQAEHGRDSQVMLVCTSEAKAAEIQARVQARLEQLPRRDIASSALNNSRCVIFERQEDIIDFADTYAPEHLIVSTSDPWAISSHISAAGSIFVGPYTPESAGDYASGTNHTLPTSAWARSYSGVNIDSFMRKMTIQEISREGLERLGGTIVTMAEAEGLQAHAQAVKARLK